MSRIVLCRGVTAEINGHAADSDPLECCGMLAGNGRVVERVYRCRNDADSDKAYSIEPLDQLAAARDAERLGIEIIGVYHSHPDGEAFPSPTDVAAAVPGWLYLIVADVASAAPVQRAFLFDGGAAVELTVLSVPFAAA